MKKENKAYKLYSALKADIISGRIAVGEKLPGNEDLGKLYGVGTLTARAAVKTLANEHFVELRNGSGSFVTNQGEKPIYLIVATNGENIIPQWHNVISGIERSINGIGGICKRCLLDIIRHASCEDFCKRLHENRVRGIFYLGQNLNGNEAELEILKSCNLPVVMPNMSLNDRAYCDFAGISMDFKANMTEGLKTLRKLGHRKVGYIGNINSHTRNVSCCEYVEILSSLNMQCDVELYGEAAFRYEDIALATQKIMDKKVTAILYYSDYYAIHAISYLKDRKIGVPKDISIMGIGGYSGSDFVSPSLSTVDLCLNECGALASTIMLNSSEWFKSGQDAPHEIAPCKIILRESCKKLEKK